MDLKLFLTIFIFSAISVKADVFRSSIDDWSYLYSSEKLKWNDASSFCKNHGMNLIAIDSPTQFKNALTVIEQNKVSEIWTSGKDLGHENIFVWSSNGQIFDYVPWLPSQPNNYYYGEECVTLRFKNKKFGLNNEGCSGKYNFICSVELK